MFSGSSSSSVSVGIIFISGAAIFILICSEINLGLGDFGLVGDRISFNFFFSFRWLSRDGEFSFFFREFLGVSDWSDGDVFSGLRGWDWVKVEIGIRASRVGLGFGVESSMEGMGVGGSGEGRLFRVFNWGDLSLAFVLDFFNLGESKKFSS